MSRRRSAGSSLTHSEGGVGYDSSVRFDQNAAVAKSGQER